MYFGVMYYIMDLAFVCSRSTASFMLGRCETGQRRVVCANVCSVSKREYCAVCCTSECGAEKVRERSFFLAASFVIVVRFVWNAACVRVHVRVWKYATKEKSISVVGRRVRGEGCRVGAAQRVGCPCSGDGVTAVG